MKSTIVTSEDLVRRIWIPVITTTTGLIVGLTLTFFLPAEYVSTAKLEIVTQMIPERYAPGIIPLDAAACLRRYQPVLLSRAAVTNLIYDLDLYGPERQRLPMEDVIEGFRKQTHLRALPTGEIEIRFACDDPRKAQRAVAALCTRFIDESIRTESTSNKLTYDLLMDSMMAAGVGLTQLNEQIRRSSQPSELLLLDRELIRKQYIDLRTRLDEVSLADKVRSRKGGPSLEFLDPASLPDTSESRPYIIIGIGALAGLVLGFLILGSLRFFRHTPLPEPVLIQ